MSSLLAGTDRVTAVFSAATRARWASSRPCIARRTDVSVVGFGDFPMADSLVPAVTVVDHSGAAVGRVAAARLLDRIREPGLAPATVHVPVALLERGSGELRP